MCTPSKIKFLLTALDSKIIIYPFTQASFSEIQINGITNWWIMENELNLQAFFIKNYMLNCYFHHMMDYLQQNTDSCRDMSLWPI